MSLHIDLAFGTLDGNPVFRRTVAAIESSLGPPSYTERYTRRIDLGYGRRARPRAEVIVNGTAWAIELEDPGDVETRLGRLLTVPPAALQARIASRYAGVFRLVRSYHCDPKGCFGLFLNAGGTRRIIFGISRKRRYVGLQLTHPPSG